MEENQISIEERYQRLEEYAKKLYSEVQSLSNFQHIERLNMLFKVMENASRFSNDFISYCVAEIESYLRVKEERDEA